MLAVERLFRRFGYSFGFAWLFVALFEFKQMYLGIPIIGYVLGAVLFICSWQVEKEVRRHIRFEEDADDLVEKLLWKISGRKKHRKYHYLARVIYVWGGINVNSSAYRFEYRIPLLCKSMYGTWRSSFVCYYTLF